MNLIIMYKNSINHLFMAVYRTSYRKNITDGELIMQSNRLNKFTITKMKRSALFSMKTTHYHPYHELFYLISGECNMFFNHNIYKFKPGDLVIIPSGEIHKTNYPANGNHQRVAISFNDEDLKWIYETLGKDELKDSLSGIVISIPDKRRDYVEGIMSKLIFENEMPDALSESFTKLIFQELLLFIIRCQKYEENVIKEIDVDNSLIQEVATYIFDNFDKSIYLDEVATKFNISRSYLSKKFKTITGFGFKEYLVNVRIKQACKYLLETDKTITDIAFLCGFNDSNYFGDAFRHIKGMAPNKFRKYKETV